MAGEGSVREVAAVMGKLGFIGFGGPAAHVAMLRDEVVRRRGWLDDDAFLDLFGACSALPGPSSTQLAIALSRRRAGWRGLIVGGACFILPAMVLVLALAWAYVRYGTTPTGGQVLRAVAPIVVVIIAFALLDLGRAAFKRPWYPLVAVGAAIGYFAGVEIVLVIALGALVTAVVAHPPRSSLALLPVLPVVRAVVPRARPALVDIGLEFLKLGVVVFGSGYVLLAFLRRDLVDGNGWLTGKQVLDAVSAGQVTPGPVFTTATFVGYLVGGWAGAVVATVAIFLPSFVLVLAVDPLVARLDRSAVTRSVLDGITLASLGLMAGLAFDLAGDALDGAYTVLIAAATAAILARRRVNIAWLVAAGVALGVVRAALG